MKKISLVVLPAITIALEILPLGAVCIFAPSPTELHLLELLKQVVIVKKVEFTFIIKI